MDCPPVPPGVTDLAAPACIAAPLAPAHRSDANEAGQAGSAALPRPAFGGEKSAFDGDFLIVGAGAVLLPSYEGSDDTVAIPGAAVAGRIGGIGISPRAAGVALDLVPDKTKARLAFNFGPVVRLRVNRTGRIKDPVVANLGKLRAVIEGGIALGVTAKRVLNPHDQLSLGVDLRWDISGRGGGGLVSPAVSYLTPVSRAQVVGLLASAEFADRRFAEYNYGVTPAGSAASGLPAFAARGGLKALNFGVFTARDLDGNLLNGGFALGAGAMYTRLKGSAARTPITTLRGSPNQWVFAAGLGFTF
jgi:outer membrane scaffolding protein for murein synthesis (MipA/OmpV family)